MALQTWQYGAATTNTFTAPLDGEYKISVLGGSGGRAYYGGKSLGMSTNIVCSCKFKEGDAIKVVVGGNGGNGQSGMVGTGRGGYNGGGYGGTYASGGGGSTDVYINGKLIVVSGGGGGGGEHNKLSASEKASNWSSSGKVSGSNGYPGSRGGGGGGGYRGGSDGGNYGSFGGQNYYHSDVYDLTYSLSGASPYAKIELIKPTASWSFKANGSSPYTVKIPFDGLYEVTLAGGRGGRGSASASNGRDNGFGGYITGTVLFKKDDILKIYVATKGGDQRDSRGGYPGKGYRNGGDPSGTYLGGGAGGGASAIISTNSDFKMLAAGGGGGSRTQGANDDGTKINGLWAPGDGYSSSVERCGGSGAGSPSGGLLGGASHHPASNKYGASGKNYIPPEFNLAEIKSSTADGICKIRMLEKSANYSHYAIETNGKYIIPIEDFYDFTKREFIKLDKETLYATSTIEKNVIENYRDLFKPIFIDGKEVEPLKELVSPKIIKVQVASSKDSTVVNESTNSSMKLFLNLNEMNLLLGSINIKTYSKDKGISFAEFERVEEIKIAIKRGSKLLGESLNEIKLEDINKFGIRTRNIGNYNLKPGDCFIICFSDYKDSTNPITEITTTTRVNSLYSKILGGGVLFEDMKSIKLTLEKNMREFLVNKRGLVKNMIDRLEEF